MFSEIPKHEKEPVRHLFDIYAKFRNKILNGIRVELGKRNVTDERTPKEGRTDSTHFYIPLPVREGNNKKKEVTAFTDYV